MKQRRGWNWNKKILIPPFYLETNVETGRDKKNKKNEIGGMIKLEQKVYGIGTACIMEKE